MKIYSSYLGGGIRFLGFNLQQNCYAPLVWNEAIQKINPSRIIEIGTGLGGMTQILELASQCKIYTFDTKILNRVFTSPTIEYFNLDCFEDNIIEKLIKEKYTTLLLCDGGNKIKEFNTFAPYLKSGDVIGVHDYVFDKKYWNQSEITLDDVSKTVKKYKLEPFMQDDFNLAAWLVFRKI